MSHNGMAWTRERSGPVGLVVQNPGDTVRPEFRTQKSSGPRLLRKARTLLGSLQPAGPSRATPQKSVSSCVKWGLDACRCERVVFIFRALCGHIFYLAVVVNSLQ